MDSGFLLQPRFPRDLPDSAASPTLVGYLLFRRHSPGHGTGPVFPTTGLCRPKELAMRKLVVTAVVAAFALAAAGSARAGDGPATFTDALRAAQQSAQSG